MTVQSWMYYNATAWEGKRPRANLEGLPPSLVKGAGSLTRPLLPLHASHGAPTHPPLKLLLCLPTTPSCTLQGQRHRQISQKRRPHAHPAHAATCTGP
jgi:hypothetical protein